MDPRTDRERAAAELETAGRLVGGRVQEASFLVLESGLVRFFVRPRVDEHAPRSLDEVQRFVFTLTPRHHRYVRRVSVGKKRLPDVGVRERCWAYVDRVGSEADAVADLGPRSYLTKTRGVRFQAGSIEVGSGTYAIALHRDHAHLMYELEAEDELVGSRLRGELRLAPRASYIAAVFNPASPWRSRSEPAVPFSEPVDDALHGRFGRRRFLPLDPALLDVEGTELVLIGGGRSEDASDADEPRS